MKNGAKCIRLNIHCPQSPFFQASTKCTDTNAVCWQHMRCESADWIDGTGMVHCNCSQPRNIFDLRFLCNSTNEASHFSNYLDLRKTLASITLSMDGSALTPDELDDLEDWIAAMTKKIKVAARARNIDGC